MVRSTLLLWNFWTFWPSSAFLVKICLQSNITLQWEPYILVPRGLLKFNILQFMSYLQIFHPLAHVLRKSRQSLASPNHGKMRKMWKFPFHPKCHQQQKFEAKMHWLPSERHFYTQFSLKWCEALSYCETLVRSDLPALFYKNPSSMQHNSPARALHPCPKRTNEVQYTTIHAITSDFLSACSRAASKPSKTRLTQPWKMRKIWKFRFHLKCHQQQKFEAKMHGLPSEGHFYTQFS